jgi:tRNA (guanine10-N2)-dimethyltransferase
MSLRAKEKLFFLVSGEHPTLPRSELCAILEAEGCEYRKVATFPQLIVLEADRKAATLIAWRASMTKFCGLELFRCKANENDIRNAAKQIAFDEMLGPEEGFVVRVKRVRADSPHINKEKLERSLGALVLKQAPHAKVNLERPGKVFVGVLSGGCFTFGIKLTEVSSKSFIDRHPTRRPYFHPSTMPPKLARCLVNLARAKRRQVLLDPFCGVGGILIEAGLIGCQVVGIDVRRSMVRQTLENLCYYGVDPVGVGVGDARKLPLDRVDVVTTDPPYGRSSTTLKSTTKGIVADLLQEAIGVLPDGGYLSLATPRSIHVSALGESKGFNVVEKHYLPVHRSLVREIAVFKK